jgi:hypothetical protein
MSVRRMNDVVGRLEWGGAMELNPTRVRPVGRKDDRVGRLDRGGVKEVGTTRTRAGRQ